MGRNVGVQILELRESGPGLRLHLRHLVHELIHQCESELPVCVARLCGADHRLTYQRSVVGRRLHRQIVARQGTGYPEEIAFFEFQLEPDALLKRLVTARPGVLDDTQFFLDSER